MEVAVRQDCGPPGYNRSHRDLYFRADIGCSGDEGDSGVSVLETIFWASVCGALHAYALYPLTVWWIGRRRDEVECPAAPETAWPQVSVVVPAPLDRDTAQDWLDSCRPLDYPGDRLEFVVRSAQDEHLDGCLVTACDGPRVRVLSQSGELGAGASQLRSDVVVLTNASVSLDSGAILRLVCRLQDPAVRVVSGRVMSADTMTGRYDDTPWRKIGVWLQSVESKCGLPVHIEPTICAMRRPLFDELLSKEFSRSAFDRLGIDEEGRTICEPAALAFQESIGSWRELLRRPAMSFRTTCGLLRAAFRSKNPRIAKGLVVELHRTLRWFTPVLLLMAMAANVLLSNDPIYMRILLAHEALYVLAALAWWMHHRSREVELQSDAEMPAVASLCHRDVPAVSG